MRATGARGSRQWWRNSSDSRDVDNSRGLRPAGRRDVIRGPEITDTRPDSPVTWPVQPGKM